MKKIIIAILLIFFVNNAWSSQELERARSLIKSGNPQEASKVLYSLVNNSRYKKESGEVYYELGRSFANMQLVQPAIFSVIKAIKVSPRSRHLSKYLEILSRLSFDAGDDVGLNYALSKIRIKTFPKEQKPILYFRFGQAYIRIGKFKKAANYFGKIPKNHELYSKARYFIGLALAETNSLRKSFSAFTQSANARSEKGIVDNQRVAAVMGRARVLYQMKKWNGSLSEYRKIPRDSKYFHDMLFESSWAMLRAGKFRSALSNFQSLHSEYYNNYYYPEATLLRSIIYLYICKVDEVNKVLKVYDETYGKINKDLKRYLKRNKSYKNDLKNYLALKNEFKTGKKGYRYTIPYVLVRDLNRSTMIQSRSDYYYNLEDDLQKIKKSGPWSNTTVASFAKKIIENRKRGSFRRLGKAIRSRLLQYKKELNEFDDQKELVKFELVSSEKEDARKKLEATDDFDTKVEAKSSRFSFRKNGYEYWPFKGEYWLDEIGNYHYLGVSRCE